MIPCWKGITLGVKMAYKIWPIHALSGHRAQKTSFLKALFSHDFTYDNGRHRQFGRQILKKWILISQDMFVCIMRNDENIVKIAAEVTCQNHIFAPCAR